MTLSAVRGAYRGRMMYVQYTDPAAYPPVEHSAQILANEGFDVLLLGTPIKGLEVRFQPHERIRVELMRPQPGGWRQRLHYASFVMWTFFWALRWRPNWVYASDPLSCPAAVLIATLLRRRLVYHEHDSPTVNDLDRPGASVFARIVMRARRAAARRADCCIVPNEQRAEVFRARTGRRDVLTVWNCPLRDEAKAAPPDRPAGLRVLYHGSIGPARLPVTVLEALAALPDSVTLNVAGYVTAGGDNYLQVLAAAAVKFGVKHRITFLGTAGDREALMRQTGAHHVGLAILPGAERNSNEQAMFGASNKAFDYMACELALLVSDLPEWRAACVDGGFGLACNAQSAESIATALGWFLEHPAETAAMGARGRQKILDDWNYEHTFAPVLDRILEGRGQRPEMAVRTART